jgi:polysaccharide biosynthesis protein PslG
MKKAFISLCAALLLCTAAHAAGSPCKNPQFYIGAGTHMGQNKLDYARAQAFFKHTKINSFRDEFYWQRLEKEPGVIQIPENLANLDQAVRSKAVLPLIPLNYGNKFYDKGDLPRSTEALEAYSRYAEFVAHTYSAVAPIFEIWNEWNAGFGSPITPRQKGSAQDYVRLMQSAVPRVRKASPKSLILGGATANVDVNWSLQFVELGGLRWVDGFSIHPYNYKHHARRTAEDAVEGLAAFQAQMSKAAGVPAVPFYLTEIGMPSSTSKNGYPEETVAAYTARFLLLARAQPYICGVWWYELFDSGNRPEEDEHRFGLFRQDGSPKPAANVIAHLADFLKDGQDFVQKRDGNIQSVRWRMPGAGEYVAYWSVKGIEAIPFDTSQYATVPLILSRADTASPASPPGELEVHAQPQIFKRLR